MNRQDICALLDRNGITPTPQRVEIALIMLAVHQHMSADQVLDRVNQQGPAVSKATVYNTLGLFAAKGLLRQVIVDPARIFYDSNPAPHHHFFNVDDGSLIDFSVDECLIGRLPALPEGTSAEGVDVIVRIRNDRKAA
jgi:Fur family iron response transcriptional regulator